jgi:PAS domain S-box-containing protein
LHTRVVTDRGDHDPAVGELIEERWRHIERRGRDKDAIERRVVVVSLEPIADAVVHVLHAEHVEPRPRTVGEAAETPRPIGMLGAVPRTRASLRTADLTRDPRYRGLPPNHPPMKSFAGVVIDDHARAGNLYVAEKIGAREFASDDVRALELLAQHAAIAIDHARWHERAGHEAAERHRTEDALRKSEERYRAIVETARDGIWSLDANNCTELVNPAMARMLGYSREEMLGRPLMEFIPEEDRADIAARLERRRAGEADTHEVRLLRKDGQIVTAIAAATPSLDAHGRYCGAVAVITDITERNRARDVLEKSRESLALAQRVAHLGSWDYDVGSGELNWSDETFRIVGRSRETFAPTYESFVAGIHPADRTKVRNAIDRAVRGDGHYAIDHRIIRPDGSERVVHEQGDVVFDAARRPLRLVGTVRDVTEQRLSEAAHRRSEEQIRDLINHASDGIFHADSSGRYTDVNEAGARMIGYTRDEIVGKTIADFLCPEDIPRLPRYMAALRAGRASLAEWTVVRKDGARVIVEVSAKFLPDGRLLGLTRDVTERRHAQDALRAAEERLRLAIEEAPIGMALVALDGRFVRVNKALCEMVRYSADELQRLRFQDITHPEDLVGDLELQNKLMRGELSRYEMPKRYVRSDGTIVDVVLHGSVVRDARGAPMHYVAQIVDVTEQRRAEREHERLLVAVEQERSWLRAVIDGSPVGIVLLEGQDAPRVRTNRRADELLGKSGAGVTAPLATPTGRLLAPAETPGVRALRGESIVREELALLGGRTTPVVVSATPIRDAQQHVRGAVVVFEDVSAQKDLERLREEWVSVIAHDLRQPVASISAQAQIQARRAGEGPIRSGAEHVVTSARRLDRMINDLLDMSRLEARRLELELQPVALDKLAAEIVERMTGQLRDHRVRIAASPSLPPVLTDALRFEQVLGNLISNAVKYGDADSDIVLELAADAGAVRVSVINRGPGIPPAEASRVFDRFQRTSGARRRGIRGIGLGLYITRGLVEANGGRIWVESEPGETTAFRFTLPIAKGATVRSTRDSRDSIH